MATLQTISVDLSFGEFIVGEQVTSGLAVSTVRAVNPTAKTISIDEPIIGSFDKDAVILGAQSLAVGVITEAVESNALDLLGLFGDILPDDFSFSDFISNLPLPSLSEDPDNGVQIQSTDTLPDMESTSSTLETDVVSDPSVEVDPTINAERENPLSNTSKGGIAAPDDRHRTNIANEPTDKFEAQYPYNKVYKSESGHLQEVDDTPGKERLLTQHVAGSYQEYKPDGNFVTKVVKDNYTIVAGDDYVTVEGRATIHVTGDCQLRVGGFLTVTSDKGVNIATKGDFRVKARSINMESTGGPVNVKSSSDTFVSSSGALNIVSQSNHIDSQDITSIAAGGNFVAAATDIGLSATGAISALAGSDFNASGTTDVNLSAGGDVNIDGAMTYIQSGKALGAAPDSVVPAEASKGSGITFIADPDKVFESTDDDPVAAAAAIKEGLANGTIKPEDLNAPAPTGGESDSSPGGNGEVVMSRPTIKNVGKNPADNIRLSTHFQLGMVSKHALAAPSAVVAQHGLSVEQIVQNLQLVAQNCLEKIKVKYPDMVVTSGFRSSATQKGVKYGAKGVSQHELGQACDMQFTRASNKQYFAIAQWIKENVPFDQLILEYKSTGTKRPWIHVSFKPSGNRKMVLTMYNGATKAHGLVNLG